MRFSPGKSSDVIAAPTLSHLVEDDQGARGQVWTVRNRPFHRPLPDDVADGCESGQHHAVEQCLDRRQWAEQEAHERTDPHRTSQPPAAPTTAQPIATNTLVRFNTPVRVSELIPGEFGA